MIRLTHPDFNPLQNKTFRSTPGPSGSPTNLCVEITLQSQAFAQARKNSEWCSVQKLSAPTPAKFRPRHCSAWMFKDRPAYTIEYNASALTQLIRHNTLDDILSSLTNDMRSAGNSSRPASSRRFE